MTAVTQTDRPMSIRNRCVIELFCGLFMLLRYFLDFSVGVGAFVIGLSQIYSFFSFSQLKDIFKPPLSPALRCLISFIYLAHDCYLQNCHKSDYDS